jgi:hypothetical protein
MGMRINDKIQSRSDDMMDIICGHKEECLC